LAGGVGNAWATTPAQEITQVGLLIEVQCIVMREIMLHVLLWWMNLKTSNGNTNCNGKIASLFSNIFFLEWITNTFYVSQKYIQQKCIMNI
jgi:hypothetical protein